MYICVACSGGRLRALIVVSLFHLSGLDALPAQHTCRCSFVKPTSVIILVGFTTVRLTSAQEEGRRHCSAHQNYKIDKNYKI